MPSPTLLLPKAVPPGTSPVAAVPPAAGAVTPGTDFNAKYGFDVAGYLKAPGGKLGANWETYTPGVSSGDQDLSESKILSRMSDPNDAKRQRDIDRLVQQAAAGDKKALARIEGLSDFDPSDKVAAGTADAVNYARLQYSKLTGVPVKYDKPGDASGLRTTLGTILKVAAPIAGALIPGVGLLGAAAIGGLGTTAGDLAKHGKVNVLDSLKGAALAGGGNYLLGNGLGSGSTGLLGSNPAAGALSGVPGGSTAATGAGGLGGNAVGAGGGLGSTIAGAGKTILGGLIQHPGLAIGALGAVNAASQQKHSNDLVNSAVQQTQRDYGTRQPLRDALLNNLQNINTTPPQLAASTSSWNPYARPVGTSPVPALPPGVPAPPRQLPPAGAAY